MNITHSIALLLAGICSLAHAQAQPNLTIYGVVDAGLIKRSATATAIGKRDANTLGFRGVEDLGSGLKALLQFEIRYEPDAGTLESGVRPLFQGQSRVGLQGGFGMLRIGRGTSAFMESIIAFEPFHGIPSPVGFYTDLAVAGFTSQPLDATGNSFNRMSNAVFYNTPDMQGFQFNATIATKEANGGPAIIGRGTAAAPQYRANAPASANPYSLSATYKAGAVGALLGVERNGIESELRSAAVYVKPVPEFKLMAIYTDQDRGHTVACNPMTKAWLVGLNYTIGAGTILAGYGRKDPHCSLEVKQVSLGYEYALSRRTSLYADASSKETASKVRQYDVGVRHAF